MEVSEWVQRRPWRWSDRWSSSFTERVWDSQGCLSLQKALRWVYCGLSEHKGHLQKSWRLFAWAFSGRTRVNGFNMKDSKNILSCEGGKELAQVAWRTDVPSLENSRPGWIGLLTTSSGGRCPCLWLEWEDLYGPFKPNHFPDPVVLHLVPPKLWQL